MTPFIMRNLLAFLNLWAFCGLASGQWQGAQATGFSPGLNSAQFNTLAEFCIEVDTVAVHTGWVNSSNLCGFTTYRIYITTSSPTDEIGAIYGFDGAPLYISTSGSFFQHPLGGALGSNIFPALLDIPDFGDLQYDSWLSIGLEEQPNDDEDLGLITSPNQEWTAGFEAGGAILMSNNTGSIVFALPGSSNIIAGPDQRVLIAQLTTDGEIHGTLQAQVYLNGDNINGSAQLTLCIHDVDSDIDGICDLDEIYGCTDSTACNFKYNALIDDGGCWFPTPYRDCNYSCLHDADMDNICDGEEIQGCTYDPAACNYNPDATDEIPCTYPPNSDSDCSLACDQDLDNDGICDLYDYCVGNYDVCGVCNGPGPVHDCGCTGLPNGACNCQGEVLDALGNCGGGCEADLDGDGICDSEADTAVFGCTDPVACNYTCSNTEEDGSCVYLDAVGVCGGDCEADADGNGICDTVDALHCGPGTHWDEETGQCVISCPSDINLDGAVAIADLLALLSDFANFCEDLD